jgi:hypothetical protein
VARCLRRESIERGAISGRNRGPAAGGETRGPATRKRVAVEHGTGGDRVTANNNEAEERERQSSDRRRRDRRAPLPWWRRPWVLVLYGVVGTLVAVGMLTRSRSAPVPLGETEVISTGRGAPAVPREPVQALEPMEDARSPGDLERLVAEGEDVRGRLVQVELFCSSINQVALRNVDVVEAAIAEIRDVSNRVPAAECKWGRRVDDEPRGDVLLVVPSEMATVFTAAPVVDDGFVQRRRVVAVVEWVGRSEALALRTVVVLRDMSTAPGVGTLPEADDAELV